MYGTANCSIVEREDKELALEPLGKLYDREAQPRTHQPADRDLRCYLVYNTSKDQDDEQKLSHNMC